MTKKYEAEKIWLRQLKSMGKELLRLLQNYSKSLNEHQSRVNQNHSKKSRNFEYDDESDKNFDRLAEGLNKATGTDHDYSVLTGRQPKPKRKRKQENYEDPWVKSWNDDVNLVNDMFGFEKPSKRSKRRRNDDYSFTMGDVFDL